MEIKRIFSTKRILTFTGLILICIFLFYREYYSEFIPNKMYDELLECYNSQDDVGKKGLSAARKEYLNRHPDADKNALKDVCNQFSSQQEYQNDFKDIINNSNEVVKLYLKSEVFSGNVNFEYLNLLKTSYDYSKFENSSVTLTNGNWFTQVANYQYIGIFILICVLIVIMAFIEEDRNGMNPIIRTAAKGRGSLFCKRILILFTSSIIISEVFYLVISIFSLSMNGGFNGIFDSIVSNQEMLPFYVDMPRIVCIVAAAAVQGLFTFALALLFWSTVKALSGNNFGIFLFFFVVYFQIILFNLISEKSIFRIFHFVNLSVLLKPHTVLFNYKNWGFPQIIMSQYETAVAIAVIICILSIIWLTYLYIFARNRSYYIFDKIYNTYQKCVMGIFEKFPNLIKELYKILISQKAILFIAIVIYLVCNIKVESGVIYNSQTIDMQRYYKTVDGQTDMEYLDNVYQQYLDEYNNLVNLYGPTPIEEEKNELLKKSVTISRIKSSIDYLKKKQSQGIEVVAFSPLEYEKMWGESQRQNMEYIAFLLILCTLFIASGTFSFERHSGMMPLAKSIANRRSWIIKKMLIQCFISAVIVVVSYLIYYLKLSDEFKFIHLDAPLQSLDMFDKFPIVISIRQFIITDILFKVLFIIGISGIATFISFYLNYAKSIICSCVLLIPYFMTQLNFNFFSGISVTTIMTFFIQWTNGLIISQYAGFLAIFILGILSYIYCIIRLKRCK